MILAVLRTAFWIGLLVPLVVYVGYPLVVGRLARRRPARPWQERDAWPTVTVTIAAHNEERDIERAVRSCLDQAYPGPPVEVLVGLDGCTDDTRGVLDRLGEARVSYLALERQGKAATDNSLVAAARSEVVMTTAAGALLAPGTLERLAAPFRDRGVGCATGVFAPRQDGSAAAGGEGLYWRLEYDLLEAESRLGVLAMASGTSMAHRRSLFRPIPLDSDGDVCIAPNVVAQGARTVFVREAVVHDDGPPDLGAVLRNRRRMALRALPATVAFLPRLWRAGQRRAALALAMHKVLRWLVPFFVLLSAVAAVGLVLAGDRLHTVIAVALLAVGLLGTLATALAGPRIRGAVTSFGLAQVAFALATLDALLGRRATMWTRR
ncbi:MAG TPA: glycosyltransferase [Candidatus Limnocylindrales bacterium]